VTYWSDREPHLNRRPESRAIGRAFGQVLREARKAAGYTQEPLARKVRIDIKYVSLLERGRRLPSLALVFALAKALRLKPEDMIARIRRAVREQQRLQSRGWQARSPILRRWKPPER